MPNDDRLHSLQRPEHGRVMVATAMKQCERKAIPVDSMRFRRVLANLRGNNVIAFDCVNAVKDCVNGRALAGAKVTGERFPDPVASLMAMIETDKSTTAGGDAS